MPTSLAVSCLTDAGAFALLQAEWLALDAHSFPRTPFTGPHWNALWWHHMRRDSARLRDSLRVYVLRRQDGSLAGIAPMMLTLIPGSGPMRFRELQFIGADSNMTELRGPVCAPEDLLAVMTALGREFQAGRAPWDWVRWSGLQGEPGVLAASLGVRMEDPVSLPCMLLPLKPTWEEFRASLPRNVKESLRKCHNAPKRNGIEVQFRVVERGPEALLALDRFFTLHRMRARLSTEVTHPDVFAVPQSRRFLRDLVAAEAQAGTLRIFEVLIAGEVVATRVGFARGDNLYLYYSGYDPALAKYSVMTRAMAEAIKWAINHGFALVNLSTGRDIAKSRWRPSEIAFTSAVQVSPALRSRLGYRASQLARYLLRH